ncbi:MAG: hypothetical protein HRT35_27750 [Algicola sp.]|nr:hypothetical protein [Algicola sp.]
MTITELIEKVKEDAKTRTPAESAAMLRKANIIDSDGYCSEEFYSSEAVAKDKQAGTPVQF